MNQINHSQRPINQMDGSQESREIRIEYSLVLDRVAGADDEMRQNVLYRRVIIIEMYPNNPLSMRRMLLNRILQHPHMDNNVRESIKETARRNENAIHIKKARSYPRPDYVDFVRKLFQNGAIRRIRLNEIPPNTYYHCDAAMNQCWWIVQHVEPLQIRGITRQELSSLRAYNENIARLKPKPSLEDVNDSNNSNTLNDNNQTTNGPQMTNNSSSSITNSSSITTQPSTCTTKQQNSKKNKKRKRLENEAVSSRRKKRRIMDINNEISSKTNDTNNISMINQDNQHDDEDQQQNSNYSRNDHSNKSSSSYKQRNSNQKVKGMR